MAISNKPRNWAGKQRARQNSIDTKNNQRAPRRERSMMTAVATFKAQADYDNRKLGVFNKMRGAASRVMNFLRRTP